MHTQRMWFIDRQELRFNPLTLASDTLNALVVVGVLLVSMTLVGAL